LFCDFDIPQMQQALEVDLALKFTASAVGKGTAYQALPRFYNILTPF
jgi:hypothetical protein